MNKKSNDRKSKEISKVFIGSLKKKVKISSLLAHLSQFGEIFSLDVKKNEFNGDCLGYAYAEVSKETFQTLINQKSSNFMGREISFSPYLDGNKLKNHLSSFNSKRVYIRNFSKKLTNMEKIEPLFSKIGIRKIKTIYFRNIPGDKKPIGVIMFTDAKEAERAVDIINSRKEGIFGEMEATYKYIAKFRHDYVENDLKDSKKRIRDTQRRHEVKPGKIEFSGYWEVERRHRNPNNLILNYQARIENFKGQKNFFYTDYSFYSELGHSCLPDYGYNVEPFKNNDYYQWEC